MGGGALYPEGHTALKSESPAITSIVIETDRSEFLRSENRTLSAES